MYCPRCGHQTISAELRFCSYCGLKLGVVKAAIVESAETSVATPTNTSTAISQPRQRDINIGVILMFAGVLLGSWTAGVTGLNLGRGKGAIVVALVYLVLVVLSSPITKGILKLLSWQEDKDLTTSRRGMGFGATLMFISTVVLAMSSLLMYGRMKSTPLFIGIGLSFALLLLFGKHLLRGLKYLVGDETIVVAKSLRPADQTVGLKPRFDLPSLPATQGTPASLFSTQRVTTAEIGAPPSITEHTTNLLE